MITYKFIKKNYLALRECLPDQYTNIEYVDFDKLREFLKSKGINSDDDQIMLFILQLFERIGLIDRQGATIKAGTIEFKRFKLSDYL